MNNGIIVLDKSAGLSSAAELSRLKRKLSLLKVGHAGTLDPMATGVLVCLCGSATRLASYAEKGRKTYSGVFTLGIVTDSDDITGDVINRSDEIPDFNTVKEAASRFHGEIEQVPPDISAVKIDGMRSYRLARKGQKPRLTAKQVSIYNFEIEPISKTEIFFRIDCSSGTYIRSVARDLGNLLECGACLSSLRREGSFPFTVDQAKTLEEVSSDDMMPWTCLFPAAPRVNLEAPEARKLHTGDMKSLRSRLNTVIEEQAGTDLDTVVYYQENDDRPLGLLKNNCGLWEIAVNLN